MNKETLMRDNKDFDYILNDFFGNKYDANSEPQSNWNKANVIIVEKENDMYLRQTRYSQYDLHRSELMNEADYDCIMKTQSNVLYIFEDGSYNMINKEY